MEADTRHKVRDRNSPRSSFSSVHGVWPRSSKPRTALQHQITFSKNVLQSFKFAFSASNMNFPHFDLQPTPHLPPLPGPASMNSFGARVSNSSCSDPFPSLLSLSPTPSTPPQGTRVIRLINTLARHNIKEARVNRRQCE